MQRDVFGFKTVLPQRIEDGRREMQAGGRGGDGTFVLRINGLVAFPVRGLRRTVQVRRQRHLPCAFHDVGKGKVPVPGKADHPGLTLHTEPFRPQQHFGSRNVDFSFQRPLLPLPVVADKAEPFHLSGLLERLGGRHLPGFQAENLQQRPAPLPEQHPRADHLGVIEDQQGTGRQMAGNC